MVETMARKENLVVDGQSFMGTWYIGLPNAYTNTEGLPIGNLYWLWWICKAWGMYSYALKRYTPLEGALKGWDDAKTPEENMKAFSWVPGIAFRPEREAQLRACLQGHANAEHVVVAIKELHLWMTNGGCLKTEVGAPSDKILLESWKTAYNLQPDTPFPERP